MGVPVRRLILGWPGAAEERGDQTRVNASVLGKTVPASLAEATVARHHRVLAAGIFETVEEAQDALCPRFRAVEPDPAAALGTTASTRCPGGCTSDSEPSCT